MPKRAWISGAAGFVAPYLRSLLEDQGYEVLGFDLVYTQDVRDYEQVRSAIDSFAPDLVFHLAAQAYVPEASHSPERAFEVNVGGTHNVLKAVHQTGSQARILLAGTSEEVGYSCDLHTEETLPQPATPYGISKWTASQLGLFYSRVYNLRVVCTRAFNHTGPRHAPSYAVSSFAKRVAEVEAGKSEAVVHGNLETMRTYADVRDVVRCYVAAIQLPSGIYNVGSENPVSMQWVLDKFIELTGKDIPTKLDESLYRPGNSHFPKVSTEKFRKATGWEPEYTLEQTLQDVLDYWRSQV